MSAWNYGVFDDDTACDALSDLQASEDLLEDMENYFDVVIDAFRDDDCIDYTDGQYALVSAAVIDSVLNETQYDWAEEEEELSDWCDDAIDYDEWIDSLRSLDFTPLKKKAVKAINAVLSENSEIRELWEEQEELYADWRKEKLAIKKRLSA